MDAKEIAAYLPHVFEGIDLPQLGPKSQGKVRDYYTVDDKRVLITTDRISAFDRVLGRIPLKGQVLNQLSAYWFSQTEDIVPNHVMEIPDPNVTISQECVAYPVEVVVRGYITGVTSTSLWTHYEKGERVLYGLQLPEGLKKNEKLPHPIITPTTRGTGPGGADERITRDEILARDLVPRAAYEEMEQAALALFQRGTEVCKKAGLILVDTKYEFGHLNGRLTLIDEVHTPDSSRFWISDTYQERFPAGSEPDNLSKEFVRIWFKDQGFTGQGPIPDLPDDLAVQAAQVYVNAFEMITGKALEPGEYPVPARIERNLRRAGWIS
jgi:phosphoribosylaminoimidazole-succinocarboxamide synthase